MESAGKKQRRLQGTPQLSITHWTCDWTFNALNLYLCSTHCTTLQTNNNIRNFPHWIQIALENLREKYDKVNVKPYHSIANRYLVLSEKRTGAQRRTKISPWFVYCMYCDRKDTFWDKTTSSTEEIELITLFVGKKHLAEGVRSTSFFTMALLGAAHFFTDGLFLD